MPSSTASVSGSDRMKREPAPNRDCTLMRPPSDWTFRFTTSMPTPRPEMFDTFSAVEKAGRKIRLSISSSLERRVRRGTSPRSCALASTFSRSMPRPSSETSMTMRPLCCAAARWIVPCRACRPPCRTSGASMPWSSALRIMCVSGSFNCSMTVLSISVVSPIVTIRTSLPSWPPGRARCRGIRANTDFTGWARIAITLSCNSRALCASASMP